MSRAFLIAALILGVLVRVRCGNATPTPGTGDVEGTTSTVAAETEASVEPATETPEATPEATPSLEATAPPTTPTLVGTVTSIPTPPSTATPTLAPSPSPTHTTEHAPVSVVGIISRRAMNVRAGPGTEFAILTMVREGQEVTVVGKTADEAWILILTPTGVRGWAWREYIRIEPSLEGVVVSTEVLATPAGGGASSPSTAGCSAGRIRADDQPGW